MRMHCCSLVLLLLGCLGSLEAARILAVLPFAAPSHFMISESVLTALTAKGHDVILYSEVTPKSNPRIKHFPVHTKQSELFRESLSFEVFLQLIDVINQDNFFGLTGALLCWHMTLPLCEQVLELPTIQELLSSDQKFDLVLTEAFFGQESMLVFSHKFNAPAVTVDTFGLWHILNRMSGNEMQLSHQPERVSLAFAHSMTFIERFRNTVSSIANLLTYNYHVLPEQQRLLDKTLGPKAPNVYDLVDKISLSLVNWHPSLEPASASPNLIPIGGIHIKNTTQPLPQDVPHGLYIEHSVVALTIHLYKQTLQEVRASGGVYQSLEDKVTTATPVRATDGRKAYTGWCGESLDIKEFMESGKTPVIFFSLGSIVPNRNLPPELIQMFVRAFAKLPYKVLWKTKAENIPNLTDNVKTATWLPQQSVLAHPNTVLFITHGGLLSQLEAFHAGVPVIGVPFFADQPHNVLIYKALGVGKILKFQDITEETLTEKIHSVINEPGYAAAAKRVSQIYHHRPMSPADSAVFWLEHVMRYGGAHLSPHSKRLSYIQLQLLDVWAAMLALLLSTVLLLRFIVTSICCRKKGHLPSSTNSKEKIN